MGVRIVYEGWGEGFKKEHIIVRLVAIIYGDNSSQKQLFHDRWFLLAPIFVLAEEVQWRPVVRVPSYRPLLHCFVHVTRKFGHVIIRKI